VPTPAPALSVVRDTEHWLVHDKEAFMVLWVAKIPIRDRTAYVRDCVSEIDVTQITASNSPCG
jgi:hypothetical protein